jgi:hypothetical protein
MNRKLALALALVFVAGGNALADDITVDPHPFVSTASRAQVREELRQYRQAGVNPWADDYDQLAHAARTMTRAEATAGYMAARKEVAAFTGEDSGSGFLARVAAARSHPRATEIAKAE